MMIALFKKYLKQFIQIAVETAMRYIHTTQETDQIIILFMILY